MRRTVLCFCCVLAGFVSSVAGADQGGARKIGGFSLKDTAGEVRAWAALQGKKATVVVFLGTECPINNAYLPRLAELYQTYEPQGVQFVAINANVQDAAARVAEHAKQHAIPFPVLKDVSNSVADQFGAQRTPEAFLIDPHGQVRYQGRIDDQIGIGYRRPQPTSRDLAEAIDAVLAGKAVTHATTPVAGCLIARVVKPRGDGTITYTKQVSRILQKHCQECHRPGQIGPMALLGYDDAAAWSETIREVVQEQRMPPWYAAPHHDTFRNDRRLSAQERATLLAWIEQGCPQGDARDLPEPRRFAEGWRIGQPDVVFSMARPFKVPASAGSRGVPYQNFLVSTDFKEDVWIQAAEARPGNRAVVHHIIVYAYPRDYRRGDRGPDSIGQGFLVGYAPGDMPTIYEPGTAKKITKGSILVFQMHYTPNGTEQTDLSSVGMIFAKEPPQHEARTRAIGNSRFQIPAGADNHKVISSSTFQQDALLLSFLPHMHLRGKSFEYRVVFPDGKNETLLSVPRYDFNWQSNYRLTTPLRLPAGTRIDCTAYFDNSAGNPNNPDPNNPVRWGDQTWEEMMIGFVDYAYLTKPEDKSSKSGE